MGRRCSEGTKKHPLRNINRVRSLLQRDLLAPTSNYKKTQQETNISRQEEKVYFSRPEPKEWINNVKANSIKIDSTVAGVKYYRENTYGSYQTVNSHYENT